MTISLIQCSLPSPDSGELQVNAIISDFLDIKSSIEEHLTRTGNLKFLPLSGKPPSTNFLESRASLLLAKRDEIPADGKIALIECVLDVF